MTGSGQLNLATSATLNLPNLMVNNGTVTIGAASSFTSTPNGPVVSGGGMAAPLNMSGALTITNGSSVALESFGTR